MIARTWNLEGPRCALVLWAACLLIGPIASGEAQTPAPKARPEDLGLIVPSGEPQPGAGRRALVKDEEGKAVVGRVFAEVANRYLMLLPSGRLSSVPTIEATLTERPFEPATKEQLIAALTKEQFKGFKTRSTRRYIYIYNSSEPFYKATSTILETMYPALYEYCRRQKLPVDEPETPLVAIDVSHAGGV